MSAAVPGGGLPSGAAATITVVPPAAALHPETFADLAAGPLGYRLIPAVVDANVLISDVCSVLRRRRATALIGQAATKMVRLLCTPRVVSEVETRMHRQARGQTADALALWRTRYVPHVRAVDPGEPEDDRIVAALAPVMANDADDVPTAHLAVLCAPCLVLTKDRDLVDAGFGAPEWLTGLRSSGEVATMDAGIQALTYMSAGAVAGTGWVAWQAARAVARSPVLTGAALALALAALTDGRPVLARQVTALRARTSGLLDTVVAGGEDVALRRSNLLATLMPYVLQPLHDPPTYTRVAAHLARAEQPVPAAALADALGGLPLDGLRGILRAGAAFTLAPGRGWQLGATAPRTSS